MLAHLAAPARSVAALTIGTGTGSGAFLSPGVDAVSHRTLTIKESLTFNPDATYTCGFNSATAQTDKIVATGVTINGGARFPFEDSNGSALPLGTVFTVIDNTAGNPIRGTFSNLADASNITVGSNTFQASYDWRRWQRSHAYGGAVACAPKSRCHSARSPRNPRSHACCQLSRADN